LEPVQILLEGTASLIVYDNKAPEAANGQAYGRVRNRSMKENVKFSQLI